MPPNLSMCDRAVQTARLTSKTAFVPAIDSFRHQDFAGLHRQSETSAFPSTLGLEWCLFAA